MHRKLLNVRKKQTVGDVQTLSHISKWWSLDQNSGLGSLNSEFFCSTSVLSFWDPELGGRLVEMVQTVRKQLHRGAVVKRGGRVHGEKCEQGTGRPGKIWRGLHAWMVWLNVPGLIPVSFHLWSSSWAISYLPSICGMILTKKRGRRGPYAA